MLYAQIDARVDEGHAWRAHARLQSMWSLCLLDAMLADKSHHLERQVDEIRRVRAEWYRAAAAEALAVATTATAHRKALER